MNDRVQSFGHVAKGLAHSPLGIIALFIVLVYGFACLVTAFAGQYTAVEKMPLIYFLVIFPVLVLAVFTWLVIQHSEKLFGPSDFKNEENYLRMRLSAVASLTAAVSKSTEQPSEQAMQQLIEVVRTAPAPRTSPGRSQNRILWVDDMPDNNIHERRAFEAIGIQFTLAVSTEAALNVLQKQRFALLISDMGRREGPREGYVLLDTLRKQGDQTPFFLYSGSASAEQRREAAEHGSQGLTNNAQELFQMVTDSLGAPRVKES